MKHIIITIALSLITVMYCTAQGKTKTISLPPSFEEKNSIEEIDHISVYPPSAQLIAEEDAEDEKNGTFLKIARLIPVNTFISSVFINGLILCI